LDYATYSVDFAINCGLMNVMAKKTPIRTWALSLCLLIFSGCDSKSPAPKRSVSPASQSAKASSVFIGSLEKTDNFELKDQSTLLEAIVARGGLGQSAPEAAKSRNKPIQFVTVRRGFPDNESRFYLPAEFVEHSAGARFPLQANDFVFFCTNRECFAFQSQMTEAGSKFKVSGLVDKPGQFETHKVAAKIEDIQTAKYSGKSTAKKGDPGLIVYKTLGSDGVHETYYLPLAPPYLDVAFFRIRIKEGDDICFTRVRDVFPGLADSPVDDAATRDEVPQ